MSIRTGTDRIDVDSDEARTRFAAERVARLATTRPDGAPHVVPVVFVAEADRIWLVVDQKPKRSRDLQRLANIAHEPRVSVLVDRYDDDWSALWWVRADGVARIDGDPARWAARFAAKYPQHEQDPPEGPAIAVDVDRWTGWSSAG
jgi:PPOX class probable F420-dependent enzyme